MNDTRGGHDDVVIIRASFSDYLFPGYLAPLHKAAAEFAERHPGYRVEVTGYDFRDVAEEVTKAVAAGEPPDLAGYFYTATQLARDTLDDAGRPLFTSVEKEIAGRTEILGEPVVIDDLVPAARDYFSYGGELVSVPLTASTVILFANTTTLKAAGVTELPTTWRELEDACAAVAALPDGPDGGVTWPNHGWLFQQAVCQQGGLLVDQDNGRGGRAGKADLNSAEMRAYVQWWQRLHERGHYRYTGVKADLLGVFDAFAEQRVAFLMTSSVEAGRAAAAAADAGFTVRCGPLPHNEDVPNAGTSIGGDSLHLRAGLDPAKRDAALAFTQFLLAPERAAQWHRANGRIPITGASIRLLEEEGWFERNPNARVATDQLAAADGSPAALGMLVGEFGEIQYGTTDAMHDVLVEGADPVARFDQAEAKAQLAIADYNARCAGPYRRTPERLSIPF
jgi:sn-glycerol 3-phosphate transport system substrate-binding protein